MKNLIASILLGACLHVSAQRTEPVSTWNFGDNVASSIKEVDANVVNGSITLSGSNATIATVEMFISGNSPDIRSRQWTDGEIEQELERSFAIDVKIEGEKLLVVATTKASRPLFSASFKITVPKHVNGNLLTKNGSLNVEHVSANISGRTTNGSISAKNSNGNIILTTTNGSVNISNLEGVISAITTNGLVTAHTVSGELKAETTNGSIKLQEISGNVDARIEPARGRDTRNSGNNITVTMVFVSDYVKLSSRGNANLTLPASRGYTLNVKADGITTSGLKNFRGNTERNKSMEGTVGEGGALIEVSTSQKTSLTFE